MNTLRPLIVFFILIVVVVGNGNAADSKTEAKSSHQDCAVVFRRFYKEFSSEYAEFTLTNATARSVWFAGYDSESPLYEVQILKDGQWEDEDVGWCGVGVERLKLRSNQSTTFRVPILYETEWDLNADKLRETDKPKVMRVGVSCSPEKDYTKGGHKTYRSEKIVPLK
jgi:hypothetical protein